VKIQNAAIDPNNNVVLMDVTLHFNRHCFAAAVVYARPDKRRMMNNLTKYAGAKT
jgi:hypothetical protein